MPDIERIPNKFQIINEKGVLFIETRYKHDGDFVVEVQDQFQYNHTGDLVSFSTIEGVERHRVM